MTKQSNLNGNLMKAIVCTRYGSPEVLQLKEVEKPTPKDDEIRIKVRATSITKADTMMRKGEPFFGRIFLGLMRPKKSIPGTGFAGTIDAVGKNVTQFKVGEKVFGETGVNFGANAEYVCMPAEGVLAPLPNNMTYEEAAPICDGPLTAMNFLKAIADIQPGQKVLINGASGSIGTAAVQIAKQYGAEVTGVCSSRNLELVKSIGADEVIDYATTDFTTTGPTYDLIFDTVGKRSFSDCKKALTPNGVYLSPVLTLKILFQMLWTSRFGTKKAKFAATGLQAIPDLRKLLSQVTNLIEAGHLKSIIDRRYSLELTAEAHRYVDTGRKKGNVVVLMNTDSTAKLQLGAEEQATK